MRPKKIRDDEAPEILWDVKDHSPPLLLVGLPTLKLFHRLSATLI